MGATVGDLDRRHFLAGAAATAALITAGCSDDTSDRSADDGGPGGASASSTTTPQVDWDSIDGQAVPSEPFKLGVASGDPLPAAVILWTRLAPDPLAADGSGGMDDDDREVGWELATDETFAEVVAQGSVTATASHGHAIHVDATGLEPATTYWYRFRCGGETSALGRTRTLPEGDVERFRLAVANCQMLDGSAYAAYRHMLDEELDVVLHLGDYIYEYPGVGAAGGGSEPTHMVTTLTDYRLRYASYKLDEDLRNAHAAVPFVVTWDDHEVANNYAGNTLPANTPEDEVKALRTAAYQAWWEHLPVRLDPPEEDRLDVHRAFTVGNLARLHVLDQRQHADLPPCRTDEGPNTDMGNCEEVGAPRTLLGDEQEAWVADSLAEGGVTWNLLGNPIVLAGIDIGTDSPQFYLETWDGYPQARLRLIEALAASTNPVVLTGDYHQGMVLDVHQVPHDPTSPIVAPELMAPPISSMLFSADVSPRTPHLREQTDAHGYMTVDVTPDRVTAEFRVLDDVTDPQSTVTTASTWVVDAGDPVAHPA